MSPTEPANRIVQRAAALCRTRLSWVIAAIAIHGLLFYLLASVPLSVETSKTSFPVEILEPTAPHSVASSQPTPRPTLKTQPAQKTTQQAPAPVARQASPTEFTSPTQPASTQPAQPSSDLALTKTGETAPAPVATATTPPTAFPDNPKPPYPRLASRLRETGSVKLRIHVLANGSVDMVEIYTSSGSPRLDRGAQTWVKENWHFTPARRGNEAVSDWVTGTITFIMEN